MNYFKDDELELTRADGTKDIYVIESISFNGVKVTKYHWLKSLWIKIKSWFR